jgi:hypothetical protein
VPQIEIRPALGGPTYAISQSQHRQSGSDPYEYRAKSSKLHSVITKGLEQTSQRSSAESQRSKAVVWRLTCAQYTTSGTLSAFIHSSSQAAHWSWLPVRAASPFKASLYEGTLFGQQTHNQRSRSRSCICAEVIINKLSGSYCVISCKRNLLATTTSTIGWEVFCPVVLNPLPNLSLSFTGHPTPSDGWF